MIDPEPTKTLVERARDGDRAAFDVLAEKLGTRLRSRVESWSQLQLGPRLDLEEVLQDTFVRAHRALCRFEWQDEDSFFGWLCGIAKKSIADAAREARRRARRACNEVNVGELPVSGPSPSKGLRRNERFDRLEAAVQQLPPDHRQVLLLSRIDGLTMKEIAVRMNRSPNAVKHLIARALRDLKEKFGDTESLHLADRALESDGKKEDENPGGSDGE